MNILWTRKPHARRPFARSHSQSAGLMQPCGVRSTTQRYTPGPLPCPAPRLAVTGLTRRERSPLQFGQQEFMETLPHSGFMPLFQTAPAELAPGQDRGAYPARIPSPWATSPRGCRSWARKGCRSVPSVRRCAGGRDTGTARASGAAEGAGSSSIAVAHQWLRHRPLLSPVANAAPVRRNQRLGEKVDAFQMPVNSFC